MPEVVEAGSEDTQRHVPVLLQEVGRLLCTPGAGAPGQEPGDIVMFTRRQLVSFKPRQEAEFCMVGFILIDLGEMGKEGKGMLWAGTAGM